MAFYVYICQKYDSKFHDLTYTRFLDFLVQDFFEKESFSFTGYDIYQSKICVEHIEQVIDESLINSHSAMNLLYFLPMSYVVNIVKCI